MKLSFEAKFVNCLDAIGGEILQVSFDTLPPPMSEAERRTPLILISKNFEFPDPATVEWHDGTDYDGGAEIVEMLLGRKRVSARLNRDLEIDVTFRISDKKFATLSSYLKRMLGKRVAISV